VQFGAIGNVFGARRSAPFSAPLGTTVGTFLGPAWASSVPVARNFTASGLPRRLAFGLDDQLVEHRLGGDLIPSQGNATLDSEAIAVSAPPFLRQRLPAMTNTCQIAWNSGNSRTILPTQHTLTRPNQVTKRYVDTNGYYTAVYGETRRRKYSHRARTCPTVALAQRERRRTAHGACLLLNARSSAGGRPSPWGY
jgi:hypothetical protein